MKKEKWHIHYFEYWAVDKDLIVSRLDRLSTAENAALVDAIERFRQGVTNAGTEKQPDSAHILD